MTYHYGDGPAGTTQHKGKREDCPVPDCTVVDDDGTEGDFFEEDEPLEDVVTAFEQREKYVTSDGTEDEVDQGCCTGRCDGSCGGYGRMLEADALRRVALIGQPSVGKTATASCCGERDDIPVAEEVLEIPLPGFVGMLHGGKADLARRAKDIVRGNDGTGPVDGSSVE